MNQCAALPLPRVSPAPEPPAFATDGRNRIVYVNPGAELLLDVRGRDVSGRDLTELLSGGLKDLIAGGTFPAPLKIGRASRIAREDIAGYLETLRRERGDKIGTS